MYLTCYKLVRKRKDETLGSLFINRKAVLPIDKWLEAEFFPTRGYAERFGWHCTYYPYAPHLKQDIDTRVWVQCEAENWEEYERPKAQGGVWILAKKIRIIRILPKWEVEKLKKQV